MSYCNGNFDLMEVFFFISEADSQFLTKCFFSYFFTHGLFVVFLKLVKGSDWYYKIFRQYRAAVIFRQFLFGLTYVLFVSNQDSLLLNFFFVLWLIALILLINIHLSEIFCVLTFSFLENWILRTNLIYLLLLIFNKGNILNSYSNYESAEDLKRDFINDQDRLRRLLPTQGTGEKLVLLFLYSIVFGVGYCFFFFVVKH
jgi:hypothetical protein